LWHGKWPVNAWSRLSGKPVLSTQQGCRIALLPIAIIHYNSPFTKTNAALS
jgi:hypothetical protein